MKHFRVIYLSKDNRTRETANFTDFNKALNFWAHHGTERATLWEQPDTITDDGHAGAPWKQKCTCAECLHERYGALQPTKPTPGRSRGQNQKQKQERR